MIKGAYVQCMLYMYFAYGKPKTREKSYNPNLQEVTKDSKKLTE